jgi:hypothetical protein
MARVALTNPSARADLDGASIVTSRFLGFIRQFRLRLAAESIGIWVASLAAIFALTSSAIDPERTAADTLPITLADTLPVTVPAADDAREEQPPEPPPIRISSTVLEDTASHMIPSSAPTPEPTLEDVNQYLWSVYERTTIKRDGSGDFTWKDVAAAARLGMSRGDYVIRGMDPDFRELLYRAGQAMDAAGIRWSILSAFRDDYRQGLASGYKARTDNSLHGGSAAIGGYGHGCAIDIADPDGKSGTLWKWLDANGAQVGLELGLQRPFPGFDPAHILPRGAWHELAEALRNDRLAKAAGTEDSAAVTDLTAISRAAPSEADLPCINGHRLRDNTMQANAINPSGHQGFKLASARAREAGKTQPHAKGAARSLARHATTRDAGAI